MTEFKLKPIPSRAPRPSIKMPTSAKMELSPSKVRPRTPSPKQSPNKLILSEISDDS